MVQTGIVVELFVPICCSTRHRIQLARRTRYDEMASSNDTSLFCRCNRSFLRWAVRCNRSGKVVRR